MSRVAQYEYRSQSNCAIRSSPAYCILSDTVFLCLHILVGSSRFEVFILFFKLAVVAGLITLLSFSEVRSVMFVILFIHIYSIYIYIYTYIYIYVYIYIQYIVHIYYIYIYTYIYTVYSTYILV